MHVIATAGHVDHGKSTLVAALTGSDPDRLAEEHRRGLSIELGYCWTSLAGVGEVAFVDVPGHERFIATMLSGIGPVPAVLFVVAADDLWMPQAAEHLAALDALDVHRGVVAVTRSDLCDPAPAIARTRVELARTTLRDLPIVAVSGRTGAGLDELRVRLSAMVAALPTPAPDADVRLWLDRCFHAKGSGTVVTGTLTAGRVSAGDYLACDAGAGRLRVRAVQSLGLAVDSATGVARVALNLTGPEVADLRRSSVLVTPDAWWWTDVIDVRLTSPGRPGAVDQPPERPMLHIGAASTPVHHRPLGGGFARLTLTRRLPLRIGDRALLRDPGSRRVWGLEVVDPVPPQLARRGAPAARAAALTREPGTVDLLSEVTRRGLVRASVLRKIGVLSGRGGAEVTLSGSVIVAGDWLLSAERANVLRAQIPGLLTEHDRLNPLDPGLSVRALATALDLPEAGLVNALVQEPLTLDHGRVMGATEGHRGGLPFALERALRQLRDDLVSEPFQAPTAGRLHELGLDHKSLGAAVKAGRLLRVGDGIVLLPGADKVALSQLAELGQPFTISQARVRLNTSRRVMLPLLAYLDRLGHTRRHEDDSRTVLRR